MQCSVQIGGLPIPLYDLGFPHSFQPRERLIAFAWDSESAPACELRWTAPLGLQGSYSRARPLAECAWQALPRPDPSEVGSFYKDVVGCEGRLSYLTAPDRATLTDRIEDLIDVEGLRLADPAAPAPEGGKTASSSSAALEARVAALEAEMKITRCCSKPAQLGPSKAARADTKRVAELTIMNTALEAQVAELQLALRWTKDRLRNATDRNGSLASKIVAIGDR